MNNGIFTSFDRSNSSNARGGYSASGLIQYETMRNSLPKSPLSTTTSIDGILHLPPAKDWSIDYNKMVYLIDTTARRGNFQTGFTQDVDKSFILYLTGVPGGYGGTFFIDWGDGITETIIRAGFSTNAGATHYYNNHGLYLIQLYRLDGAISDGYVPNTPDYLRLDTRDGKCVGILSFDSRLTNLTRFINNFTRCDFVPTKLSPSVTTLNTAFSSSIGLYKNVGLWDTSNITDMGGTFYGFTNNGISIFNENLSTWNTSNVTNMASMFQDSSAFNNGGSPNINNWNTANVTNMASMFGSSYRIVIFNQPIGNWNTGKVTTMAYMFGGSDGGGGITAVGNKNFNQDISNWDVSKVTTMQNMFYGASAFNNLGNSGINNWNTISLVGLGLQQTFKGATSFNQPIGNWNISGVTSLFETFRQASTFNQDLNNWNTSNVTTMNGMFNSATSFNQPLNNWNVRKVTTFVNMFNSATNFNGSLSGWAPGADTAGSSCNGMFYLASNFVGSGLSSWDTSKVTSMTTMFRQSNINEPIGGWNVSNVTNMDTMFTACTNFNQNLDNWNVRKVTAFNSMFNGATNFNGSLSGWAPGADTTGANCAGMFQGASSFVGSGLSSWDVSKINNMTYMFYNASSFNTDIGGWSVGHITSFDRMFAGAQSFNNGGSSSIGGWNTGNVTNMSNMFLNNYNFNQPIGSWNVSKVTTMDLMLSGTSSFQQDISGWNLAGLNAATALDNFMLNRNGVNSYSTANYDVLLIGWNNNKLATSNGVANWRTDLRPNFGGAKYTAGGAAATARAALVSYGWTITDGGAA